MAFVALAVGAAACTPPAPGTPPQAEPAPPVINSFTENHTRAGAPQTSVLRWNISDPNNDSMTCRVDRDGDGTIDRTITECRSFKSDIANYASEGTYPAVLEVEDSTGRTTLALQNIVVGPAAAETYDIDLRLGEGMDPVYVAAFENAAARWESIIGAGVVDMPTDIPAGLFDWLEPYSGIVDDLLIDASVEPIDGPGDLLGQAGALLIREGSNKPYFGIMRFDEADMGSLVASGRLESTILHEMAHVLGMGGLWLIQGFVSDILTEQPRFNGPASNAVYQQLGGVNLIPLEVDGGQGTALAHWRESVFGNELMTGYLNSGFNPVSTMTVAALADMGYAVDFTNTDPYQLPSPLVAALRAAVAPDQPDVELIEPINQP